MAIYLPMIPEAAIAMLACARIGAAHTVVFAGFSADASRYRIGPLATPDHILIAAGLPKTCSGEIMRRILRKIAERRMDQLGDTSTLADPSVVDALIEARSALPDECVTLHGCFD